MASRHNSFRVFYGLGFIPWDGHARAKGLRELIEGPLIHRRCTLEKASAKAARGTS